MKILRIQLHPFGGVVDRIVELHDGLNVIERPNEFGKSTLNNALWHALFTPSKLTPKKRELTIGRWFPKPSGDHVRVTLDFEAQGQRWTLQKCWGVGESSSLRSSDAAAIAEPTSVQEKLSQLLQRNEATWRNVLFVNQAQLNNTIDELKNNSAQIDDLEPLLAGVAAIPGDIAEDKLAKALDDRIEVVQRKAKESTTLSRTRLAPSLQPTTRWKSHAGSAKKSSNLKIIWTKSIPRFANKKH
jgi:DNA repair exonuclease SbcCD ATPase subunit